MKIDGKSASAEAQRSERRKPSSICNTVPASRLIAVADGH
jgi:hypothetical protein